ncbi:hypothetical protein DPMN_177845 [Dreissena polymorpha]|uniref:Uncharacterized protein n=1 Tax=Dreissena polymorpha TaxID=45954 RepID=A0A9D4IJC4_DREPO|nr:hypothetical protein DPMN_177845 [Dreissena polymorpha]
MHLTDYSSRSRYQQETPRQSETVPRPPCHLQETPRQYATMQDSFPDRRSTNKRLQDIFDGAKTYGYLH